MRFSLKSALAGVATATVLVGSMGMMAAHATTPPYEPDGGANGTITFYDQAGNIVTTGSTTDTTTPYYALASVAGRVGDNRATLFGYSPVQGQAPGAWGGEQLSLTSVYNPVAATTPAGPLRSGLPLAGGPTTGLFGQETSGFAGLAAAFPNNAPSTSSYFGLYQLRLKTSGPGIGTNPVYQVADIFISGTTWTLEYPPPAATATTLTVTPASPQNAGTAVTLNAAVTPSNAGGTVQFMDGSSTIGSPVTVVSGTASTSTSSLTVAGSPHSLTAVFTPTNTQAYASSTSNVVSYTITTAPAQDTTTGLVVDPGTGQAFSPVTFTATVASAGTGTPAGTVSFSDYNGTTTSTVGSAPLSGGTAVLSVSNLAQGSHTITAAYTPADPTLFNASSGSAAAFNLTAPAYTPDVQNIQAEIPAGTLVFSTPYTTGNPLDLGNLVLNSSATLFSGSAPFGSATDGYITITDTRAGNQGWTLSAQSSNLTGPNPARPINSQNVGLTNLNPHYTAGNGLNAGNTPTTFNNPAANPPVGPTAAGTQGLGGSNHQVVHDSTANGTGTISYDGTLTITAPTSTPAGTYTGTITFTIIGS